jgi:hypothetical protein
MRASIQGFASKALMEGTEKFTRLESIPSSRNVVSALAEILTESLGKGRQSVQSVEFPF